MTLISEFLESRNLTTCPLPLWKLKLTDDEYQRLKEYIRSWTITFRHNCFRQCTKECALLVAEWWRREYDGGTPSERRVLQALGLANGYDNDFRTAYRRGMKALNIPAYCGDGGHQQWFDSLRYQGGFPMNFIVSCIRNGQGENRNNAWFLTAQRLRNNNTNNDFIYGRLPQIARQSLHLIEFGDQLSEGITGEDQADLPFAATDAQYNSLHGFHNQRGNYNSPFTIKFLFEFNYNEFEVKYEAHADSQISNEYLNFNGLAPQNQFCVRLKQNSTLNATVNYRAINDSARTRFGIDQLLPYNEGDIISFFIDDVPFESESLEITSPFLLYQGPANGNTFIPGNRIGQMVSLIIMPTDWTVADDERLNNTTYNWNGKEFNVIRIPADFRDEIRFTAPNGDTQTITPTTSFSWIKINRASALCTTNFQEPIFNAADAHFVRICDDNSECRLSHNRMEYRNRYDNQWGETPGYGKIFARRRADLDTKPCQFINIGTDDSIEYRQQITNGTLCEIHLTWTHGTVTPANGHTLDNGVFTFSMEEIGYDNLTFVFTPTDAPHNVFTLTMLSPFTHFSIVDTFNNVLPNGSFIPLEDWCSYNYSFVGQNASFSIGTTRHEIANIRCALPAGRQNLSTLKSKNDLHNILNHTNENILDAVIKLQFQINQQNYCYYIKEFPYIPRQTDIQTIIIETEGVRIAEELDGRPFVMDRNNRTHFGYNGRLMLFNLNEPNAEPKVLNPTDDHTYIIPEEIANWGEVLAVGRAQGHVRPVLIDTTHIMTPEEHRANRESAINAITTVLRDDTTYNNLGSEFWEECKGWFENTKKYSIPASSILQLQCIAQDGKALLFFAFKLFCDTPANEHNLENQLRRISQELPFCWFWTYSYWQDFLRLSIRMDQGYNTDQIDRFWAFMKELWAYSLGAQTTDEKETVYRILEQNPIQHETFNRDDYYEHYDDGWIKQVVNQLQSTNHGGDLFALKDADKRRFINTLTDIIHSTQEEQGNDDFLPYLENYLRKPK